MVLLFVAAVVAVLDRRNLSVRRLAVLAVVMAVMTFALVNLVSSVQLERLRSVRTEAAGGTLDQRTSLWGLTYDTFSQHPLSGVGADSFRDVVERTTGRSAPAHDTFLGVLADLGAPGLLLFVLVFASLAPPLVHLPRRLRRTWLTIAVIWILGAATLSWEHRKITWFLVFLLLAQSEAWRRAARADGEERRLPGEGDVIAVALRPPASTRA